MTYSSIDIVWILLCTVLVIVMQPGFVLFETGLTRAKNSISVAIKNIADFCVTGIIFGLLGYGLMFGISINGLIGSSGFFFGPDFNDLQQAFMLFQLSFCATSVTIISGAVAERICFSGYLIVAIIMASCIYPVVGHWIWAGLDLSQTTGWLENIGFIDFAGATVVHAVGGSAALAAIIIIGPRCGRFDTKQKQYFGGHNLTYAATGTFLLLIGWLGFNGGGLLASSNLLPLVFLNTIVAGVSGGVAVTIITWSKDNRPDLTYIMMGILAGLVAITGSCSTVSTFSSALIGMTAGGISLIGLHLLEKFKIDDAVGAVPVHLFPGIWGTVCVALFSHPESFIDSNSRWEQLQVQLTGTVVGVGYSFCIMYVLLSVIQRFFSLRVSSDVERIGLNAGEHGVQSELYNLAEKMHTQYQAKNFSTRVDIDPFSDIGALQVEYNRILDAIQVDVEKNKVTENELRRLATTDGLTKLANRHYFDEIFDKEWHRAIRNNSDVSLIFADIDHFKQYNDSYGHQAGDLCLVNISRTIASISNRACDLVARYGGEEFTILLPDTELNGAKQFAERIRTEVAALKIKHALSKKESFVSISIGVASMRPQQGSESKKLLEMADEALYRAKKLGRNRVEVHDLVTY